MVHHRDLKPLSTKNKTSQIVLEHTMRSTDLANMIVRDLDYCMSQILHLEDDTPMYISSEGLAFSAKGDATLNLATYKGVLMAKLYEHYQGRLKGLYTYSPITMKSVAGCAKKGELANKGNMIVAFSKEAIGDNPFQTALRKGGFKAKTNFSMCVDDIVDSYWAVKTMLVKEGVGQVKK